MCYTHSILYNVYTLGKEYTWMIGLGYTVYSGYKETTAMIYAYVYKEKGVRIDDACKMKTACAMHIVTYSYSVYIGTGTG